MATHKDAIKRSRQSAKRRMRNRHYRTMMRNQIKKLNEAISEGQGDVAQAELPATISLIQRIAQKGIIHPKQAARRVSRLAGKVNGLNRPASDDASQNG